jgi:hypothetical protein
VDGRSREVKKKKKGSEGVAYAVGCTSNGWWKYLGVASGSTKEISVRNTNASPFGAFIFRNVGSTAFAHTLMPLHALALTPNTSALTPLHSHLTPLHMPFCTLCHQTPINREAWINKRRQEIPEQLCHYSVVIPIHFSPPSDTSLTFTIIPAQHNCQDRAAGPSDESSEAMFMRTILLLTSVQITVTAVFSLALP